MPLIPASSNARISLPRSPRAAGSPDDLRSGGRNAVSARSVQMCTPSPAARATREPGVLHLAVLELHDHPLVRGDGVGVTGDFLQPRIAQQIGITALVARQPEVERLAAGFDE